jgi:ABC-2 type transport system ATP-binding protein
MGMEYIVRTNLLTKKINNNKIVSHVNMKIKKGEIYGLLGPNGAGKTSIMKMVVNLLQPTSGEIEFFGQKLCNTSYEHLKRIGSIIEYPIFYEKLTGRENLEIHCSFMGYHNKNAIDQTLKLLNLEDIGQKKVKDLSLGMKQKLGIARAIITKPEFLVLDEPINGLDPISMKEVRNLFMMLNKDYGITFLISSHIMGEIEQIADTIGFMKDGSLIEELTMNEIREKNTMYIQLVVNDLKKTLFVLEHELDLSNFKIIDEVTVRIYDSILPNDLSKTLITNDIEIESIHKSEPSLEEYFLSRMKV